MTINLDVAPRPAEARRAGRTEDGRSLAALVADLRRHLRLGEEIEDAIIASSLREIGRFTEPLARWQAACDSTLGHWLMLQGRTLDDALGLIPGALSRP